MDNNEKYWKNNFGERSFDKLTPFQKIFHIPTVSKGNN